MQQYRKELLKEAEKILKNKLSRREEVLGLIQNHAINQIKEGYTSFRITNFKKEDEAFLAEWGSMSAANIKVIKFKCYENTKKYIIKQFDVDLKNSINVQYSKEGNTLKMP